MVSAIVSTLTEWVTAFVDLIILVFTSLTDIFWDKTADALTLPGVLALMATAVGLIYLGLRFILQLFPGAHQL